MEARGKLNFACLVFGVVERKSPFYFYMRNFLFRIESGLLVGWLALGTALQHLVAVLVIQPRNAGIAYRLLSKLVLALVDSVIILKNVYETCKNIFNYNTVYCCFNTRTIQAA